MKNVLIITGQDKIPKRFQENLEIAQDLISENCVSKVIYSTSPDRDISFIPQNDNFAVLRTQCDPGPRNYKIQTHQLSVGLNLLDDEDIVLKTRPDVLIQKDLIEKVFSYVRSSKVNCLRTKLSHKVWYPWYDATKPFYVADECFGGKVKDLKLFINYRKYPLFDGITHVRRSIEPFRSYEPLKDYLASEYIFDLDCYDRINKVKQFLNNDDYLEYISCYYFILNKYFYIHSPLGKINFRPWNNSKSIINAEKGLSYTLDGLTTGDLTVDKFILGYDNLFLERVCAGEYKDEVSQEIYKKIKEY